MGARQVCNKQRTTGLSIWTSVPIKASLHESGACAGEVWSSRGEVRCLLPADYPERALRTSLCRLELSRLLPPPGPRRTQWKFLLVLTTHKVFDNLLVASALNGVIAKWATQYSRTVLTLIVWCTADFCCGGRHRVSTYARDRRRLLSVVGRRAPTHQFESVGSVTIRAKNESRGL